MIMAMVAKTDDVGGDDCDDESDTAFYTNGGGVVTVPKTTKYLAYTSRLVTITIAKETCKSDFFSDKSHSPPKMFDCIRSEKGVKPGFSSKSLSIKSRTKMITWRQRDVHTTTPNMPQDFLLCNAKTQIIKKRAMTALRKTSSKPFIAKPYDCNLIHL